MARLLLYAPNIHQGGGKVLLLPLLHFLENEKNVILILDARMNIPDHGKTRGKVFRVKPSVFSRLTFEWRMRQLLQKGDLVLCMGNLPPLFAHRGVQRVFVQNRYLIDNVSLSDFSLLVRLRLLMERWWLRSRAKYVDRFMVQTPTMQKCLKKSFGVDADILALVDKNRLGQISVDSDCEQQYDFLYVASGEPHKNHKQLIKAWIKLAEKGFFPSLCLTLDANRFPELCALISARAKKYGLNISMIGECSYADVQQLYRQAGAMIYPSLFESFGLPLIEAATVGLPVLASHASYVTDVIEPSAVFDPVSAQSIANAVQNFPAKPAVLRVQLLDANEFLKRSFSQGVTD